MKKQVDPEKVKAQIRKATKTALDGVLNLATALAKATGGAVTPTDIMDAIKTELRDWDDKHPIP